MQTIATTGGLTFTTPQSQPLFSNQQTINENLNTPLGNFTSSVSIPKNAIVMPPVSQCNNILNNVSSQIPTLLNNTIQPATQIIKQIEGVV